jgi:hypothetical protein
LKRENGPCIIAPLQNAASEKYSSSLVPDFI